MVHGLSCPVKYVRLVRRRVGLRNRFYAQLVCQGTPYRKPQHQLGSGIVGLDLGPSTLAVVAEQAALLQPFCPEVLPNWRHLRRLDRQLDRQRRANNPANYDERGRVKKGRKRWKTSKRQRRVQARRREVYRKLAATRKRSHGQLAHRVLALGDRFQLEQISYRAWQKQFGRSVGRSAPGMFVSLLSRLAATCWRAGLRAEHPAGQALAALPVRRRGQETVAAALAHVRLRGLRPAGPLQRLPGPFREPGNLRAEGTPGRRRLAAWGTPRAGGLPARHHQPTREWTASAVLLWSAPG